MTRAEALHKRRYDRGLIEGAAAERAEIVAMLRDVRFWDAVRATTRREGFSSLPEVMQRAADLIEARGDEGGDGG